MQQLSFWTDPLVAHMMIAIQVQGDALAQLTKQNKATASKVQTCIQQTVQQFQASSTHLGVLLKEIKTQNAELEKTQGEEMLELEKISCELEATLATQKAEENRLNCKYQLAVAAIKELQSDCALIRTRLSNFPALVLCGRRGGGNHLKAMVEAHMSHYTKWPQSKFAIPSGCTMQPLIDYARKLQNIKSLYPGDF
jgi:predicted RNase H-like nuclease (RuvC/YqgF family)